MKNILVILVALCAIAVSAGTPPDSSRKAKLEELKKLRRELYVKKLALTEQEAVKFFPIWDEFELKQRQAKKEFRDKWKGRKPEDLSEQDAEAYLNDALKLRETELQLFRTYTEKLKPVLPATKILKLNRVQKEVQRELMEKMRELKGRPGHRPGRGGPNRPPR